MEPDVPPETPNMLPTAGLGTSASKRSLAVSTEPVRRYAVAGSQASHDQPQIPSFRTILPEVDVLARLLLGALLSLMTGTKLSGQPSSCQYCLASSFSMVKALLWSEVDDAVSPTSSTGATSPWRMSSNSFHHPQGESGIPKTPFTISIKAPFSIPGKPLKEQRLFNFWRIFFIDRHPTRPDPLRLRHQSIDDTI